jgi:hypothetical protein
LQIVGYTLIGVALIIFNYPYFRKIQAAVSVRRAG